MNRFAIVLGLVIASTATASAQGVTLLQRPSLWQSDRGATLKVLSVDAATGNFSGILISSRTGPCPGRLYDVAGSVRLPQRHVVFTTSLAAQGLFATAQADCAATVRWSGRGTGTGAAAVKWTTRITGPNGRLVTRRGTEIFRRI